MSAKKNKSVIKIIVFFLIHLRIFGYASTDFKDITYYKSKETLAKITETISKKEKGVYLRFGDGDVSLALNRPDSFQVQTASLSQEMREAFELEGKNVFKCLVLNCPGLGFEQGMLPGKFACDVRHSVNLLNEASKVWGGPIKEIYTPTALHFCATDFPSVAVRFIHFLKSCSKKILVGNENIPSSIRELLFGLNCTFVPTPSKNAYAQIDRAEKECLAAMDTNEYTVIITAMGCSGRAFQKRIWKQKENVFLFDFGSLMDALCGWDTRAWIGLSNFDKDLFLKKLSQEIKVLVTAALIDDQSSMRKQEYIASLDQLQKFGFLPYIVEPCRQKGTFLDQYSHHVLYCQNNDYTAKNKGVNEVASMRAGFNSFQFDPQDMILKLTGRYYIKSDSLLDLVTAHPSVDVFIKYNEYGTTFTGCYAMRAHYLNRFLQSINLVEMERKLLGVEYLMTQYIKQIEAEGARVMKVGNLDLKANIFGTGIPQMTNW